MDQKYLDVVHPEEIEYFVQSLREFQLSEVGNKNWLDIHEILLKLAQQATLEASSYREEVVKEFLILHSKLKVLVHEAFCILIWKTKVLPELISINPNPIASFLIYTVFFHEGNVIALLELALFHEHGCKILEESSLDLIDYCAQNITQLIALVSSGFHETGNEANLNEAGLTEMERQKRNLVYKIGLRCLSIMNYLVDKLEVLPLSAGSRLVSVHDLPCILSEVLHLRPWLRKTNKGFEKFIDDKWVLVVGDKMLQVTKTEAQTWFCFRGLLLNISLMANYKINDFRQRELGKCHQLLSDPILDQLPPLIELKHFLCTLTTAGPGPSKNQHNLLMEEVPMIKRTILDVAKRDGGYEKIADDQSEVFFNTNKNEILEIAKRLNEAYNTDLLAEIEEKHSKTEGSTEGFCGLCKKEAEKRCSRCMSVFYCSRECQVNHWMEHKELCTQISK